MHSPATLATQGMDHRSHALGELHVGLSLGNNELVVRNADEVGRPERRPPCPGAGPAVTEGVELERARVDVEGDGAAVASARVAGLG